MEKQSSTIDDSVSFLSLKNETTFSSSPAREIRHNYHYINGIVHTRCGSTARFEGQLQRSFYQSIDAFDFDVIEVRHYPVCIHFLDTAGRCRLYYPVALVCYSEESGRAPTLFEINEAKAYERDKPEYEMKFAAGRAYSEQMGWDYEVATEKSIHPQLLENALFLRSFRRRSYDELLALRLKRIVQAAPGIEARALATAEGIEPLKVAECWSTLWALVARGQLRLDPLKPIAPSTAIRASKR